MQYGLIFSVDADKDRVKGSKEFSPIPMKHWDMAEDGETEYDCWGEDDPGWHRKWCACLNQAQMDKFMKKMAFGSMCQAMGALGMPQPDGTINICHCPAFAVDGGDESAMLSLYVTPYLIQGEDEDTVPKLKLAERDGPKELREEDWEIIMDWFGERYELT